MSAQDDDQSDDDITTMKVCTLKNPIYTAERFLLDRCTHPDGRTLLRWQSEWYRWREGCWHKLDEEQMNSEVLAFMVEALEPASAKKVKPLHVSEVRGLLQSLVQVNLPGLGCYLDGEKADGLVPCINGTVDLTNGELLGHTPLLFNLSKLPVVYDPKAKCGQWLRFLKEVYEGDAKRIALIQEWMGYNLTEDNSYQKMMLMVGAKRGGKGTIARIMSLLVGPHGLASPTLDSLATNFGVQPLIGRKTAIVSDARLAGGGRVNYQATLERLLTISGGNELTVDRKFLGAWTGMLNTRFTIITNMLPGLHDEGAAFTSRLLVLMHNVSFYGREDVGLTARLEAELPGIMLWAMEGYRRLVKQGAFTITADTDAVIERMERLSSPIKAFINDRCVIDPNAVTPKRDIFEDYKVWLKETDDRASPPSLERFFEQLYAASDHVLKPCRPRLGKVQVNAVSGIKLNDEPLH